VNGDTQALTRNAIFTAVFFAFLAFLLYQMGKIIAPFFSPLIWAAILTIALAPVHRRVRMLVKGRTGLAAGIMTFGTLLAVIGPVVLFLAALASQAVDFYQWTTDLIQSGRLAEKWSSVAAPFLDRLQKHPLLAGVDFR
jgi:predicted PurR-regulated permease PerM